MWGHNKKAVICKPGREFLPDTESAGILISDFQLLELCFLFKFPGDGILL